MNEHEIDMTIHAVFEELTDEYVESDVAKLVANSLQRKHDDEVKVTAMCLGEIGDDIVWVFAVAMQSPNGVELTQIRIIE
jgi:hypothetical protein